MDNILKFCVFGKIQPKQSARFTRYGVYQNPKVKAYELEVQRAFRERYKNDVRFPENMPLVISLRVYLPIPSGKSKTFKEQAERGQIRPTTKPDTDNCGKIIKDALNGLAYYDDKQIVTEHIEKWYSQEPRVEVMIEGDYY